MPGLAQFWLARRSDATRFANVIDEIAPPRIRDSQTAEVHALDQLLNLDWDRLASSSWALNNISNVLKCVDIPVELIDAGVVTPGTPVPEWAEKLQDPATRARVRKSVAKLKQNPPTEANKATFNLRSCSWQANRPDRSANMNHEPEMLLGLALHQKSSPPLELQSSLEVVGLPTGGAADLLPDRKEMPCMADLRHVHTQSGDRDTPQARGSSKLT